MIVRNRKLYPQSSTKRQKEEIDEGLSSESELKQIHQLDPVTKHEQIMIIEESKVPL